MMNLVLKSKKNTHYATAEYDGKTITVRKGSRIFPRVTYSSMPSYVLELRNDSSIVSEEFVILKNVTFNSVTAAACFVTGRSVNGYIAWRIDDKISLKEYRSQVGE